MPPAAQRAQDARLWLTKPDRTALEALQPGARCTFRRKRAWRRFSQSMKGSTSSRSMALDSRSEEAAQLLMRKGAAQRAALLKELFTTGGTGIEQPRYLRVSIGSSDMNERVYSYDDLPPGETDVDTAKFDLGSDRADVIPALKEIFGN